jgi:hypothetical protein
MSRGHVVIKTFSFPPSVYISRHWPSVDGVHEELSRLHPHDDDDLADVLPDPFSLPRIKPYASEVDIMEVVARCPRKSSPHVDGWRFETLRALGSPCTVRRYFG